MGIVVAGAVGCDVVVVVVVEPFVAAGILPHATYFEIFVIDSWTLIANPPVSSELSGTLSVVVEEPPVTELSGYAGFGLSFAQVP